MKNPSQQALVKLTRQLKRLGRYEGPARLRAYTESAEFRQGLMALEGSHLQAVLSLFAEAKQLCNARAPLPRPGDVPRAKWDHAMVAKFRKAWAEAGTIEGAARLCGITKGAAKLAHYRYVQDGYATRADAQAA